VGAQRTTNLQKQCSRFCAISTFTFFHVVGRFRLPFGIPFGLPGRTLGGQRGARTTPKAKKGAKKRGPRTGLEKGLCLEGAKPLKVSTLTHFQLFFRRPQAPKKETKLEPKGDPNRKNPIQEHPWACFWPLVGSIFEFVFSTLIFNAVQAQNGTPPPPNGQPAARAGRLWGAGNNTLGHAGGGYYVGSSSFQQMQALCSPLSQ
jgi:hypothetical protein